MPTNRSKLAHAVLVHGERLEAGKRIGLWPLAGVGRSHGTTTLKALLKERILMENDSRLAFGAALGYIVGVSIGAESLRAGLFDANGVRLLEHEANPINERLKRAPQHVMDEIAAAVREILEQALHEPALLVERDQRNVLPLVGVAVAWPRPLHRVTKMLDGPALHNEWRRGLSVTERVAKRLGLPAERSHGLNDANAIALGLAFDATREDPADLEDVRAAYVGVAVRLGGTVGAGTVIVEKSRPPEDEPNAPWVSGFLASQLIEGTSGVAGELGHLAVDTEVIAQVNKDRSEEGDLAPLDANWTCICGRERHLEAFASARALVRRLEASEAVDLLELGLSPDEQRPNRARMHEVIARMDDPAVQDTLFDIGRLVGHCLAAPILLLNPRRITITGSLAHPRVEAGIQHERPTWRPIDADDKLDIDILYGNPNKYAACRGAALTVFRECVYNRLDVLTGSLGNLKALVLPFTAEQLPY